MENEKIDNLEELERMAENGDFEALKKVAGHYYWLTKDKEAGKKAFYYLKKAEHFNDSDLLFKLGNCYAFELGVNKDIPKAVEYYEKAIKGNHPGAYFNLAVSYRDGFDDVEPDFNKAKEYFLKAKELGKENAEAALRSLPLYELVYNLKNFDNLDDDKQTSILYEVEAIKRESKISRDRLVFIRNKFVNYVIQNYPKGTISDSEKEIVFGLSSVVVSSLIEENNLKDAQNSIVHMLKMLDTYQGDDEEYILETNSRLWWRLASITFMQKDYELALKASDIALDSAKKLLVKDLENFPYDLLINIYAINNNILNAVGAYEESIKCGTALLDYLNKLPREKLKRYQMDYVLFLNTMCNTHVLIKHYDEVEKLACYIFDLIDNPKNDLEYDIVSQAHLSLGLALEGLGDYVEAINNYDKAYEFTLRMSDTSSKYQRLAKYALESGRLNYDTGNLEVAKVVLINGLEHCYYHDFIGCNQMLADLTNKFFKVCFDLKDFNSALGATKNYLEDKEAGNYDDEPTSDIYSALFASYIATVYEAMNDPKQEEEYLLKSLDYLMNDTNEVYKEKHDEIYLDVNNRLEKFRGSKN